MPNDNLDASEFPQEACSKLWNHQQGDRDLMRAAHKAVSVLYNYTGEVVCYSLDNTLRNNAGWGFQVRRLCDPDSRMEGRGGEGQEKS